MIAITASPSLFIAQSPMDKHITVKKLESFRSLHAGWHYGEGIAFDENIVNNALNLHNIAVKLGFFETDAFPYIDGSIMITIYHKADYFEFTLMHNNEIMYRRETDDEEVGEEAQITFAQAKSVLEELRQDTWRSSDSYISDITIVGNRDLLPQHLRTSGMGFQLLISNAFPIQEEQFVNTS
jgi:hypothetical protein